MRTRRVLCATVLVCEAFVVWFALLAAAGLSDVPGATLLWVGCSTALACLLVAGLLRHRWAYVAGSALQVLLVLSGIVVPAMFLVGGMFAALWVTALVLARRVERAQAGRGGGVGGAGQHAGG